MFSPKTLREGSTLSRGASLLSRGMSILEEDTTMDLDDATSQISYGSFDCMVLHKKGLYIGGQVCTCVSQTVNRSN